MVEAVMLREKKSWLEKRHCWKKIKGTYHEASSFSLGYPDSNQERQDQNLQCYHYTISQCYSDLSLYCDAKLHLFSQPPKYLRSFFCLPHVFFLFLYNFRSDNKVI